MATTTTFRLAITIFVALFLSTSSQEFSTQLSKSKLNLKKEKLSHLRFYFHDIVSGPRPTAVRVVAAPTTNTSPTTFGAVAMMDDPLTLTPNVTSKIVGRAQGIYAEADMNTPGLLMAFNFVFLEGKYNGSTLSVLGRNPPLKTEREMPIVGGSGLFRLARGYAQAKTHWFDLKTGDATVEYNVYVFHY